MGQLRSACRAVLLQNASPAQALAVLDQFAARIPGAMCSTAFCVILDPATGRFTYSSAGHPPGILVHPDGRAELLEEGRSLSLVIEPGRRRSDAEGWLPAGAVLLLYTDGLVERRRRPLTTGIAAVAAALQDGHRLPVQDLASQVMAALAPSGGYEDDVALVLYRHPATEAPRRGTAAGRSWAGTAGCGCAWCGEGPVRRLRGKVASKNRLLPAIIWSLGA
jgi:serine phosphatase RsbU (regulator of sigma subunit)